MGKKGILGRHFSQLSLGLFQSFLEILDSDLQRKQFVVFGGLFSLELLDLGFELISVLVSLIGFAAKRCKFLIWGWKV